MSTRKSPGEDGVSATTLRRSWPVLGEVIAKLFEDLIKYGYFPRVWKTADVVTILKGRDKDRDNPKSFRPVSLLPVLGKALEHLVCCRIQDEIRVNMNESQHGFTKGRSTMTAITELMD